MMLRFAACGFLFICILALGTEQVDAGSSFLSPAGTKPQLGKPVKKPAAPKMTRRDSESTVEILEGQFHDIGDNKIMFSAPFEIGIPMSESQYQEYGHLLQKLTEDVLTDNSEEPLNIHILSVLDLLAKQVEFKDRMQDFNSG
ncbi:ghrelin/obestatin prepropeptide [Polyodon spathula]|uniref:ghrelin/obestatin prepropeptide n=1 Tax=Polyodon spathula TaxID=7913 RepID=UPI001B7F33CE|nr:ghrelin/obestatin prepropeptide [Polyodon spathula]